MRRDQPGPGARPATATATTTASLALFKDPGGCPFISMFQHRGGGVEELNSPDPSPSKLRTVQLVQSVLHVAATPELGNSLPTPVLMSVGVVDFACLAHEVLQVLPGGRGREVLNDHAIASPGARWSPPTKSTPVAISTSKVTTSTTTSAAAASCVLDADSSSIKIFSIEILNID